MANVVYVGNYPSELEEDDILDLFQGFEGLVLLRSIRKNSKCYSFVLCQDQEQVLDVVLTLNGTYVGERNLVVRASDDELQEIIEECDDADDYVEEEGNFGDDDDFANDHYDPVTTNSSSSLSSGYRQPRNPSRLIAFNGVSSPPTKKSPSPVNSVYSNDHEGESANNFDHFETASYNSYASSVRSSATSPGSTISSRYGRRHRGEKFSFVSVINFPNGTTSEELEYLFADFNPHKIVMRCPIARGKNNPTEAVVCFFKYKNAADSVLNLDNTLYNGRVLLVTECDDISCISDLVKVHER